MGVDPKTVRREHPPDNPEIRLEMNKIAEKRRRFGYRRIGVLLERVGMIMNEKKLYPLADRRLPAIAVRRIYREEGLSVRRRRGRKRARGSRTPMPVPLRPNQRWSLDFLSDTFGACRKFRILAVNDDCCRENLCLIPNTSISGARVARELDALVRIYGKPACIVSDNGTEFTSKAILKWANDNKVEWHYIDPGKPQQNGYIESFNGSLRPSRQIAVQSPAGQWTNASTRKSSTAWPTPDERWPYGATITTTSGHIHRSAIKPPQKRAERLSYLMASRPARLPHPKPTTIKTKDSRYD